MIRARGVRPRSSARLLGADRDQGRAVDDARRVAGVVDVVDPLDPVVLLERHVVEARVGADAGEAGLEPGQALGAGVGTDRLVVVEHGQAVQVLDRDDGVGEVAVGPRLGGTVVRLGGVRVDVVAAPALDRRDQVGADALGHEAGLERGRRVGGPGATVGAHGHPAHRLDAAGEDQVLEAAADPGRRLVDGLEAGGAETVELHARHGVGVAGLERGGLGDVATLLTDRRHHAEDDVVDASRVEGGVADLDLVEETDDEVDRLHLVQRARCLALAAGRPNVVVHECFSHDVLLRWGLCKCEPVRSIVTLLLSPSRSRVLWCTSRSRTADERGEPWTTRASTPCGSC